MQRVKQDCNCGKEISIDVMRFSDILLTNPDLFPFLRINCSQETGDFSIEVVHSDEHYQYVDLSHVWLMVWDMLTTTP